MPDENGDLTLEDLQTQYEDFCANVKAVKQNTYWRTTFHSDSNTLKNENKKN